MTDKKARYSESDSHIPNPTDVSGTLLTAGTAGHADSKIEEITKVFEVARNDSLLQAAKALDPKDDSVDASMVVLPTGATIVHDDPEVARKRVLDAAKDVKPVVLSSPGPAEAEAGISDKDAKVAPKVV